jgi:predicted permease
MTMFLYAVPAYLLIKAKIAKPQSISSLASILVYICTPAIIIHGFQSIEFSLKTIKNLGVFFLVAIAIHLFMFGIAWIAIRKKRDDIKYRIVTVASACGNCGFLGIPLIKALLPDHPEAVVYAAIFSISMNLIGFTLGCLAISNDTKYISIKRILLNPAMIASYFAIPMFILGLRLPNAILGTFEMFVTISTPICMFVLGMRLATVKISSIFTSPTIYISVVAKQIIMPLVVIAITFLLPLDSVMEKSMVILCSCPVASVVLNLSELIGNGQDQAANSVLLSTVLSVLTIPLISFLI